MTSSSQCSYEELKRRQCLALSWSELDDLSKYVRDKPGWERQFKTFVQLRGNIAYVNDRRWGPQQQDLSTGVPDVFWRWLHIRKGDLIALMETGSQITLGQIEVLGIARVHTDAFSTYRYDSQYHHAHQVLGGLKWVDWDIKHFGELPKPEGSFNALTIDNSQIALVEEALSASEAIQA
ncbi:hypothetical protein MED297_13757 [Reinekea sp. MED297]|uniref:Uncharacterized protein n=2 Tax=Reinekea TaxID=230494 RepID=A4BCM7_9GAMM|nr:hypothetical protein MED297_13757 [Reinekea sp. MED297] [Reinekea blandensis MED297]